MTMYIEIKFKKIIEQFWVRHNVMLMNKLNMFICLYRIILLEMH